MRGLSAARCSKGRFGLREEAFRSIGPPGRALAPFGKSQAVFPEGSLRSARLLSPSR